jgi:hypothetical protein
MLVVSAIIAVEIWSGIRLSSGAHGDLGFIALFLTVFLGGVVLGVKA